MPRVFRFPPLTPFTKKLLIALSATFVTALLLTRVAGIPVVQLLALLPAGEGLGIHTAWQLFTYPLVGVPSSGGVIGLIISLVFLWLMMAPFEARFGARTAAQLCIVATLASGLVFIPASMVLPAHALIGPSPLFLGVIGAMAASVPSNAQMSFFGVLPMTPKTLVLVFFGLTALMNIADGNFAGVAADAAAIGSGILFMRWWMNRLVRPDKPKKAKPPNGGGRGRRVRRFEVIEGGGGTQDSDDGEDSRPRWLN